LIALTLAAALQAATLDNYKQRLDLAAAEIDSLMPDGESSESVYAVRTADRILRDIPTSEKVEWPGGTVETNNVWLSDAIASYRVEKDLAKRGEILKAIHERLLATSASVAELQTGVQSASTKDGDKQKLAEILRRPEYQPAAAPEESLFQRLWREFWDWIEHQMPRPNISPDVMSGLGSLRLVLQIVVFGAVAALLAFLIWRFLPYFSARFGRGNKDGLGDRVILGETIASDESAADIFAEAERLAREGDLRGAIRKGYIAALCELGDRRMVRLARFKTNRDYLRDVRSRANVHQGLATLTHTFERNWYGLNAARPEDWEAFREGYDRTMKEARAS
jgi:hypothetical protein